MIAMKILTILLISLAFFFKSYAQTARIAHRSHSGSDNTFKVTGSDNWGIPSGMQERIQKRDSALKARADSIARKARFDSLLHNRPRVDTSAKAWIHPAKKPKATKKH